MHSIHHCIKHGFAVIPPGADGLSIELSTTVDIRDQTNKELVMRLVTDIQSGDVFHTDLNGFQVSRTLTTRFALLSGWFLNAVVQQLALCVVLDCALRGFTASLVND